MPTAKSPEALERQRWRATAALILPDLEQGLIQRGWAINSDGRQLWASKAFGRLHFHGGVGGVFCSVVARVRTELRGTPEDPEWVETEDWRLFVGLSAPLLTLLELAEYVARP